MSAFFPSKGFPPRSAMICRHDPCWCGHPPQTPAGMRPWSQEAHDAFITNADGHRPGGRREIPDPELAQQFAAPGAP